MKRRIVRAVARSVFRFIDVPLRFIQEDGRSVFASRDGMGRFIVFPSRFIHVTKATRYSLEQKQE
jgi:hypothetical protein